jgi:hypothetical protein
MERELRRIQGPILIMSTVVGRGMFTLGEALAERLDPGTEHHHIPVEEFLPKSAVREDLERYRKISSRFPFLLKVAM